MSKPLVYVAGPMQVPDPISNTRAAILLQARLIKDGVVTPIIPHLSILAEIVSPMDYEDWLAYDFEIIAKCDALLRVPGVSKGADREVQYALMCPGVMVFDDEDLERSIALLYGWALEA